MCSVENHGVMFSYMYVYMLPTYAHVLFCHQIQEYIFSSFVVALKLLDFACGAKFKIYFFKCLFYTRPQIHPSLIPFQLSFLFPPYFVFSFPSFSFSPYSPFPLIPLFLFTSPSVCVSSLGGGGREMSLEKMFTLLLTVCLS